MVLPKAHSLLAAAVRGQDRLRPSLQALCARGTRGTLLVFAVMTGRMAGGGGRGTDDARPAPLRDALAVGEAKP